MILKHKDKIYICLFITVLLILSVPFDYLFGSNTDWFNQHVSIAEQIRQACIENHTLLPDYSYLGGGSNQFMFAYYGLLRFDVLVSLALPMVAMQDIIIIYSIIGIYSSCLLCLYWLKKQNITNTTAVVCTLLFASAACFFHAHRQLMFINYMPFLLLLLIGIDKQNKYWMTLSFTSIFLHSFFFSISCFVAGGLYVLHKKEKIITYLFSFFMACGLACALLIPSALAILEQSKDAGAGSQEALFALQLDYKNLLYSAYGCGLTIFSLYSLFLCIKNKKTRFLAISILLVFSISFLSYLMNGTLYVRDKIYIPFTPLLILLCAYALEFMNKQRDKTYWLLLLLLLIPLGFQNNKFLYLIDIGFLMVFLLLHQYYRKPWIYVLLLLVPMFQNIIINRGEEYIAKNDQRKERFSEKEVSNFYEDSTYRFDTINASLTNANETPVAGMKKSTMYSSTMNQLYSTYYYDILKTPISIKNRVALLANQNPFLLKMMSVRYLQTTTNNLPVGYEIKQQNKKYVLAENKNVLPIAYATNQTISNKEFNAIRFPYNLDTLVNHAVVEKTTNTGNPSKISKLNSFIDDANLPSFMQKTGTDTYAINTNKKSKVSFPLPQDKKDVLYIVSFTITDHKGKEVQIEINNILNKRSSVNANYPNNHSNFVYMLSQQDHLDTIDISFSKGSYTIQNVSLYEMPISALSTMEYIPLQEQDKTGSILEGTITIPDKNHYFVTSLPYQKGYKAFVDDKEIDIEVVNTAFVGFPIEKGKHTIEIEFHAPGKNAGMIISILSIFVLLGMGIYERRTYENKTHRST